MTGTTIVDTLDTEEQIEEAKASLDRINGWINEKSNPPAMLGRIE